MIEIAMMREFYATAQELINFRRCLIQGVDVVPKQLLQIPHFTEEEIKHVKGVGNKS